MTTNPEPHGGEVHELPLAQRLIEEAIRDWLTTATGLARAAAGSGALNDYERGVRYGIDTMRHLHLDNYPYTVVLRIIDQLTRAGLMTGADGQAQAAGMRVLIWDPCVDDEPTKTVDLTPDAAYEHVFEDHYYRFRVEPAESR